MIKDIKMVAIVAISICASLMLGLISMVHFGFNLVLVCGLSLMMFSVASKVFVDMMAMDRLKELAIICSIIALLSIIFAMILWAVADYDILSFFVSAIEAIGAFDILGLFFFLVFKAINLVKQHEILVSAILYAIIVGFFLLYIVSRIIAPELMTVQNVIIVCAIIFVREWKRRKEDGFAKHP